MCLAATIQPSSQYTAPLGPTIAIGAEPLISPDGLIGAFTPNLIASVAEIST